MYGDYQTGSQTSQYRPDIRYKVTVLLYGGIVCLCLGIGTLVAVSLIPYIHWIGIVSLVCLSLILLCGTCMMFTYTSTSILKMKHSANVIASGEVVAYHDGTEFIHLSAIHEEAKIPALAPAQVVPKTIEDRVIEKLKNGETLRQISDQTGLTVYRIRKIALELQTI